MAITRAKKEEIVSKIAEFFRKTKLLIFLHFKGLSVADSTDLRRKLRAAGGASYYVAKKRLFHLALKKEGMEVPPIAGEVGFVFSGDDPLQAAKEVYAFVKARKGIEIGGGIFERTIVDGDVIKRLALIPPREVLLAQLLGVLQGPMRGLAGMLAGPQRGLVVALKQIAEKNKNI